MDTKHKPQRVRSPSYPSVSLEVAIDKLNAMYSFTHKTPVLISTMLPHWGFETAKSANGMKLVAALKSYGLIEDFGQKDQRKIAVTDAAFKIINLEAGSDARKQLIKDCALKPDIYKHMWDYYGENLPHFDSIKSHLVVDKKFNAGSVKSFLDDYKRTIEYAELSKDDVLTDEEPGDDNVDDTAVEVEVGDLIQWQSNGVLQFQQPKKVRALQEHEGQDWVFVEGSNTGILLNEVVIEQKGQPAGTAGGIAPPVLEEVIGEVKVTDREREWIRGPLSKEVSYRIIVSGDLGPKEIGKLIRLLEAQRDILTDE